MIRFFTTVALWIFTALAITSIFWIAIVVACLGITVFALTAPFRRLRYASLQDRRVRRVPDVRAVAVIRNVESICPAACCCQNCGWVSSN